jgi:hypothetical protein
MRKAARKNTTPAKRATPDPIIRLIDAADEALDLYRRAECNLSAAEAQFRAAADDLERITKALANEKPATRACAMALFEYAWIRTSPRVNSIQCIRQDVHSMLKESKRAP